ncbi:hypothetical protein EVAR_17044_1 [Eumeta japonica]|uniref:Uncharacterized protein n=1 Tax=Eumeta variegata TaxID=151549 RepID=A0A4C1V653_EUMVA|nr:hypothetical protein EVAR_17044_1 [Eumeta japonica]
MATVQRPRACRRRTKDIGFDPGHGRIDRWIFNLSQAVALNWASGRKAVRRLTASRVCQVTVLGHGVHFASVRCACGHRSSHVMYY